MSASRIPAQLQRAIVLALLAGALALIALRGIADREARLRDEIGPLGRVVVLTRDIPAEHTLRPADLAYREMPLRWVAPETIGEAGQATGLRTAVALRRGTALTAPVLTSTSAQARDALARGERVIEVLGAGSSRLVRGGSRVDVVRTTTRPDGRRDTAVIAEGVEVIDVRDADDAGDGSAQITATLRVPLDVALRLAAAQGDEARLRLLPRAAWDRRTLGR